MRFRATALDPERENTPRPGPNSTRASGAPEMRRGRPGQGLDQRAMHRHLAAGGGVDRRVGPLGQRLGDLDRLLVAVGRLLRHHLPQHGEHPGGHVGAERLDRLRFARLVRDELRGDRPVRERRLAGEHEVERAAERVDVGPDVHHVADGLLRGEVVGRAEDALVVVLLGDAVLLLVEEPGQAHVEDLDDAGAVEQQVARLDVAVNHAEFVGVLHADRRLGDVVRGPDRVERLLLQHVAGDDLLEARPVHVLHDEEVQLLVLVDVVGADDVRVVEGGDGPGLAVEPVQVRRVVELLDRQHLERDEPLHERVFAQVDRAHAAGADQFEQPVLRRRW